MAPAQPPGMPPGTIASPTNPMIAATNNITLGLEGRYSDYGTQRFNAGRVTTVNTLVIAAPQTFLHDTYRDVRIETGEVMAKVNYKFGGPVVAKY